MDQQNRLKESGCCWLLYAQENCGAHPRSAGSKLKLDSGADPDADNSARGTVKHQLNLPPNSRRISLNQLRRGESDDSSLLPCLIKCSGQVIPTQMVHPKGLRGTSTSQNPSSSQTSQRIFVIQLEVYGLQQREVQDHEAKYHIKKEKSAI